MCSVPSMWRRIRARARVGVALAQQRDQLAMLVVGARQNLLGMRDPRDQLAHLTLHLGHLGDEVRRVGSLGDADVKANVGAPVILELDGADIRSTSSSSAAYSVSVDAFAGEHDRPELDGDAVVEHGAGVAAEWIAVALGQRRPVGDEGPA